MKVYISGPITGTKDYMERFSKAQKYLESLGCSVVNPALVNSNIPKDTTYEGYMRMRLCMLTLCDTIYLLKGYEDSKDALMELNNAKLFGCKILYEKTPADMFPRLSR